MAASIVVFIFILSFLAIGVWIIVSTYRNLVEYGASKKWWQAYWLLVASGMVLGIFLAFFMTFDLPEMTLKGMPVPIKFELLRDGEWIVNNPPMVIQVAARVTNVISGVAFIIFIFKMTALVTHFNKAMEEKWLYKTSDEQTK